MHIHRRFLYTGLFLAALGGVLVAADVGLVDTVALADALRLSPVIPLAIGAGLVLRRTQFGLPGGMLAAAIPGLVLGSAFAVVPRFAGDCGARGDPALVATAQGTFDHAASISVTAGCGSLNVRTAAGNGWKLEAGNTTGRAPVVRSDAGSLSIDTTDPKGWNILADGRDAWYVALPTAEIQDLSVVTFANSGRFDLAGARLVNLDLTANASDIVVDASAASVADLSAVLNVGLLSITLPAESDLTGSLRIGGGELRLCAPAGLGLRITVRGMPVDVSGGGLQKRDAGYESPNYASATHHADVRVTTYFGAIKVDPIGGCK